MNLKTIPERSVKEIVKEKAVQIANAIGSPWGEGATYNSPFQKRVSLNIDRQPGDSHLDNDEWKMLVEDIVTVVQQTLQTERQKREEMERDTLISVHKMFCASDLIFSQKLALLEARIDKLTQPNNSK